MIAVVDYGMGNLRSVAKALKHVAPDCTIVVSADPDVVRRADRVVLPGQSAMPDCIRCLDASGLRDVVIEAARTRPFLGICLGLQMLFDRSEEGPTPGLGLFPGGVVRFRDEAMVLPSGERLKVPHMGWSPVRQTRSHALWTGIPDGTRFYFAHITRRRLLARLHGLISSRRSSIRKKATAQDYSCSPISSLGTGAAEARVLFEIPDFPAASFPHPPPLHPSSASFAFLALMHIIPAIDIKDGHCVRLKQGEMHTATVFSEDPAAMAQHWLELGAQRLHLVDLNGAVAGVPKNELAIREIVSVIGEEIPVQLGGGIRDLDTIERYLDDGITYVIIGTAAVKNPGFLHDACYAFPGHIIVGLDARDGKVATDGWSKLTGHDVVDLGKKFQDYGVEAIIYTDIGRDGMLTGVNVEATVRLARELKIPVIASGGVASIADIEQLVSYEKEGIIGAIAGRALYEGKLDFKAALKAAKG